MKSRLSHLLSSSDVEGETQDDPNPFMHLKPLVLLTVLWEFLLVLAASLFSPPMGEIASAFGVSTSLMVNFPILDSLFFHSLAMPLAAVLMLVTLGAFGIHGRIRSFVMYAGTFGCILTSGSMAYILLSGGDTLSYLLMYAGMALGAGAAVSLLLALWPHRAPDVPMKLAGRSLAGLTMWVTVAAALVAVTLGSYAALGNAQWNPSTTIGLMPGLQAAHENLVITVVGAAIVVLAAKWFKAEEYTGTPGLFAKVGLYGTLVGIPIVVASMLVAAPTATGPTGDLTIFSGILLQASLFIMFAVMYEEARRLHVRGPLGVLRESLTFGMLFVLFWVNIAVTLPGIYVAVNLARFNGQVLGGYYQQVFAIGHEHALVTLMAISLMMLVALMFGVKGVVGALAGVTMTVGYVVCTTANVFYIFFLMPNGPTFISYMSDGIALMFVGVLLALMGITISRRPPAG